MSIMKKLPLPSRLSTGWFAGAIALALFGASCASETPTASESAVPVPPAPTELPLQENGVDPLPTPGVTDPDLVDSEAAANAPLPVPTLIPPTTSAGQVARIQSGRSNPFAPLEPHAVVISRSASPAPREQPATVAATLPPPQTISTVPVDPTPMPVVQPGEPTLSDAIAAAPGTSVAPTTPSARLADLIEITGVVEVGGQVSIILRAPNEHTSRYVRVGDYLANGQVLVKRVDMQAGGEPLVILEQDGVEVPRYVGSGAA